MNQRTTFRRTCDRCDATFFSPDRYAVRCPKCVKRYGAPQSRGSAAVSSAETVPAPEHRVRTCGPRQGLRRSVRRKQPRRPRRVELTDELRLAIQEAYRRLLGGPPKRLRDIHREIADELNTTRAVVSEVLHGPHKVQVAISPELREQVIQRYKVMVYRGERPPGGRRKHIAAQLNLPFAQVAEVIRQWRAGLTDDVSSLSRQQFFEIEKAYWRHLEARQVPLLEIPAVVARELGLTEWQAARRIDLLHDDLSKVSMVAHPGPDVAERIEAAYREYLTRAQPPSDSLHATFSKLFGVTPKQVYRVLLEYRNRVRAQALGAQAP